MECSQKRLIYHKQTIVDEDGVIQTKQDLTDAIYKTVAVSTKKKIDQQGQTHVYTIRVIKKHGVQLNLF
nr:MAG TPA: hypothetical protein [Microviridae sp.]